MRGISTSELIRRRFLNSDARRATEPILKRQEIRSSARTEGECLLQRARRTLRDAEGDRDDAGRSNCETGGPITGPEITGPVPRPPDP